MYIGGRGFIDNAGYGLSDWLFAGYLRVICGLFAGYLRVICGLFAVLPARFLQMAFPGKCRSYDTK